MQGAALSQVVDLASSLRQRNKQIQALQRIQAREQAQLIDLIGKLLHISIEFSEPPLVDVETGPAPDAEMVTQSRRAQSNGRLRY